MTEYVLEERAAVLREASGRTVCDLRTVLEGQDPILADALSP